MAPSCTLQLSDIDKLATLQRLDQFRTWRSLDQKRFCLVCSEIITGHEIRVVGGTRGAGPLRIICSTENCSAIPMDWILPTEEILDHSRLALSARNQDASALQT